MNPLSPGELVAGRYRMLRRIGEGGMGAVWAAHHELIDRDVAIKISDAKLAARADLRERFLAEARAVGRLRHPNVVDVVDFGELPTGQLYIVFELLNGQSIEEFLEQNGHMTPFDAVTVAIEVCRGLEAAHALGVVHRDLKPANVFLHESPTGGGLVVKLLDFGISKSYDQEGVSLSMTQTGVVLGTPQYMSVEQARGLDDIDTRTDVWGVGVVLHEMISGAQPFEGTNYNALLYAIMNEAPITIASQGVEIPEALDAVIQKCLAKPRGQRYQSAKDVRGALEAVLGNLSMTGTTLAIERVSGFIPVARASSASLPDIANKDIATLPPPSGTRVTWGQGPPPPPPSLDRTPAPALSPEPLDLTADLEDAASDAPHAGPATGSGRKRRLVIGATVALAVFALTVAFVTLRGRPTAGPPTAASPSSEVSAVAITPGPPAVAATPSAVPVAEPTPSSAPSAPATVEKDPAPPRKGKRGAQPAPAAGTVKGGVKPVTKVDNAGF